MYLNITSGAAHKQKPSPSSGERPLASLNFSFSVNFFTAIIKLQCPAGKANPSPPVGPALGQHGLNIMAFCKEFNSRTAMMTAMMPTMKK